MNTLRTIEYINISRNIRKCENALQLKGLKQIVLDYHRALKQDSGELMAVYIERETKLNPELTIIDNPKFNIRLQNKQL